MSRATPVQAHLGELLDRTMVAEALPPARYRAVRTLTVLIGLVATSFVLALLAHIGLAFAGAEVANPVTRFVTAWADAVDLGLHNVVGMGNRPLQVAADNGIAALSWVLIGALVTTLIDRSLLPHEHQRKQRRAR
jgi:hypothetical protein